VVLEFSCVPRFSHPLLAVFRWPCTPLSPFRMCSCNKRVKQIIYTTFPSSQMQIKPEVLRWDSGREATWAWIRLASKNVNANTHFNINNKSRNKTANNLMCDSSRILSVLNTNVCEAPYMHAFPRSFRPWLKYRLWLPTLSRLWIVASQLMV